MSSLFAEHGAGLYETGASGAELEQNNQLEDEQFIVPHIETIGSRSSESHEKNNSADFVQCKVAKCRIEDRPEAEQIVCCEHCLALALIFDSAKAFSSAISKFALESAIPNE